MKSAPTIAFDYRPARSLAIALLALTALAVPACLVNHLPLVIRLTLVLAAASACALALRAFLHPRMVRIAHGEAGWLLVDRDGNEHAADLVAHVDRGIMQALEFRVGGRAHRFVLLADNCDRETARRLRLVLAKHMPGDDDIR